MQWRDISCQYYYTSQSSVSVDMCGGVDIALRPYRLNVRKWQNVLQDNVGAKYTDNQRQCTGVYGNYSIKLSSTYNEYLKRFLSTSDIALTDHWIRSQ